MPCGSSSKAKAMKKEYGKKKGMQVYYATKNSDRGFYGHLNPKNLQRKTIRTTGGIK